jgi:hypothetical protein
MITRFLGVPFCRIVQSETKDGKTDDLPVIKTKRFILHKESGMSSFLYGGHAKIQCQKK